MLHTHHSIIQHKTGLLHLADLISLKSGAIPQKLARSWRDHEPAFILTKSWQDRDGNLDALINRSRRTAKLKKKVDNATVSEQAFSDPAHSQQATIEAVMKLVKKASMTTTITLPRSGSDTI